MLRYLFFGLMLVFCWACADDRAALRQNIDEWEHRALTDRAALDSLANYYQQYLVRYPNDSYSPELLYLSAENQLKRGKYYDAIDLLEKGMRDYATAPQMPDMLALAAEVYSEKLQDEGRAEALFSRYRKDFPQGKDIAAAEFFFISDVEKARSRLAQLDAQLDDARQRNGIAETVATEYLEASAAYVRQQKDDYTATYCDRAAKLASAMGESLQAVEFWTKIYEEYPNYPYYTAVLFWLANEYETGIPLYSRRPRTNRQSAKIYEEARVAEFMQDNYLKKAEALYKELLHRFPQNEMAASAQNALKYLGKDPNEVVASFGENNK